MSDRLAQISGHLTNVAGRGLLAGEVAIITGKFVHCKLPLQLYQVLARESVAAQRFSLPKKAQRWWQASKSSEMIIH